MTPRDDQNALLDFLFEFARQELTKDGEFFPFAATMGEDGQIAALAIDLGDDQPDNSLLAEQLAAIMNEQASSGTIKASGVCLDVRVSADPDTDAMTDAVQAKLEHRDGDAVSVFLPYEKKRLRGVQFGEIFATAGEASVFD